MIVSELRWSSYGTPLHSDCKLPGPFAGARIKRRACLRPWLGDKRPGIARQHWDSSAPHEMRTLRLRESQNKHLHQMRMTWPCANVRNLPVKSNCFVARDYFRKQRNPD